MTSYPFLFVPRGIGSRVTALRVEVWECWVAAWQGSGCADSRVLQQQLRGALLAPAELGIRGMQSACGKLEKVFYKGME